VTPPVVEVTPPVVPCEGIECGSPRGQLQGYAGGGWGYEETYPPNLNREYGTLANHSADDVSFTFNEDGDEECNDTFGSVQASRREPGAPAKAS
jgi:hypothetical protein